MFRLCLVLCLLLLTVFALLPDLTAGEWVLTRATCDCSDCKCPDCSCGIGWVLTPQIEGAISAPAEPDYLPNDRDNLETIAKSKDCPDCAQQARSKIKRLFGPVTQAAPVYSAEVASPPKNRVVRRFGQWVKTRRQGRRCNGPNCQ